MTHSTAEARKSKAKRKRAERKAKHKAVMSAAKARDARIQRTIDYLAVYHDDEGNPTGPDALYVHLGIGKYHREPNDAKQWLWDSRVKPPANMQ